MEKLNEAEEYNNFLKNNPNAYPCSGFFVIDRENKKESQNQQHIDYFLPEDGKIYSFKIEENCKKVPVEPNSEQDGRQFDSQEEQEASKEEQKKPEEISLDHDFDFNDVENLINKKMEEEGIKNNVQKLLFSLQKLEGEDYLVGTIFISSLGLIKVHIKVPEKEITRFEKKSFMDMINIFKKNDNSEDSDDSEEEKEPEETEDLDENKQ